MLDSTLPSDAFRLGSVTVVPSLNRLVRDGNTEDVEPRVMRVLAVLAETPGEVVTRDALLDAVWVDTVVNEDALTRAVSELRKALGADATAIETIRGRGYRLTVHVEPVRSKPSAPAAPVSARPTAARRSGREVAVLALAVAAVAFAVALWAAWPRTVAEEVEPSQASDAALFPEPSVRLDSTSEYYIPGASEMGVYYDSTEDRYFRFVPKDTVAGDR